MTSQFVVFHHTDVTSWPFKVNRTKMTQRIHHSTTAATYSEDYEI